ncbi:MAG TPA: VOC family protein [Gemmatimonadaceae bacterium]|nr:VOC family protein [Gemmatimonadaceae bacterium]
MTGIGGVFFKARDPVALAAWYREQLGIEIQEGGTYGMLPGAPAGGGGETVWSVFPADTTYFGGGSAGWMVNYRVANLDAMLQQLRAAGAWVSEKIDESDFGRFGWAVDPEGTRFELWEAPAGDASKASA